MTLDSRRGRSLTSSDGSIRYMDASSLTRKQRIGGAPLIVVLICLVIAAGIGAFGIHMYFDKVVNAGAKAQAAVEANLSRDINVEVPQLASLATNNADAMKDAVKGMGRTYVNLTTKKSKEAGGVDLFVLPTDIDKDTGKTLLNKGYAKLNAVEASALFKGSWRISKEPEAYVDTRLHYVDFIAGDVKIAIANACATQGFDTTAKDASSGTDESSNEYAAGTLKISDKKYNWRVSAIRLDKVYDISGLPENAVYVGIRITEQA